MKWVSQYVSCGVRVSSRWLGYRCPGCFGETSPKGGCFDDMGVPTKVAKRCSQVFLRGCFFLGCFFFLGDST